MSSQGIRLTNMLYNHGPGSILETVQGPVVVQGWDKMISEIYHLHNRPSRMQLSYTDWLKYLEIAEPRLSSQLLSHGQTGDVKLHSIPSNESINLPNRRALIKTTDFPNFYLCRKGPGHPRHSVLFRWYNSSNKKFENAKCPVCNNNDRTSPIRFVSACNAGHLDDLPWNFMVHKKSGCDGQIFNWREENTSTSGIRIECRKCGDNISLNQGVGKLPVIPCSRVDPSEVMEEVETCDRSMNLVLRSSTSIWQSESITTITIPDDDVQICLKKMRRFVPPGGFNPSVLLATPVPMPSLHSPCEISEWDAAAMLMKQTPCPYASGAHSRQDNQAWVLTHCLQRFSGKQYSMSPVDFNRYLDPIIKKLDSGALPAIEFINAWKNEISPVRVSMTQAIEAEYNNLFTDKDVSWPTTSPLFIKKKRERDSSGVDITYQFGNGNCKVNLRCHRVDKLRAVTALKGFKRPVRDANGNPADMVPLSHKDDSNTEWFAAVKAMGEGILITFEDDSKLCSGGDRWNKWENKFSSLINDPPDNRYLYRGLRTEPLTVTVEGKHVAESHPMFVWWHTLSHHLIRTIQQDTGYSSSAISERVYAQEVNGKWTGGILLYVTEGGMDGTLGGLTSLVPNLQRYLDRIAEESDHCSNDPLCADVTSSSLEHDRACYACTYNSETSCGHRNLFLDRLLLRECAGL